MIRTVLAIDCPLFLSLTVYHPSSCRQEIDPEQLDQGDGLEEARWAWEEELHEGNNTTTENDPKEFDWFWSLIGLGIARFSSSYHKTQ